MDENKGDRTYRILLVEDTSSQQVLVKSILKKAKGASFHLTTVSTLFDALNVIQIDVQLNAVLLDLGLPDSDGIATLVEVAKAAPHLAIVVLTATTEETLGSELIQRGAQDYIEKSGPENKTLLPKALRYAIERKVLEREIAQRERLFMGFMENHPAAAFVHDESGRNVYGNRQFDRYFGKQKDIEDTAAMLVLGTREKDMRILRAGGTIENIEKLPDADGTMRSWMIIKFMFEDTLGRNMIGGTAVDVTDLEHAKEALRQSRELFRYHFYESNTPMAVVATNNQFRLVNSAFCRMSGYEEKELSGLSVDDLLSKDEFGSFGKIFDGDDKAVWSNLRCVKKSGETYQVERTAFVVKTPEGQPLFGFLMDQVGASEPVLKPDAVSAKDRLHEFLVSHSVVPALRVDRQFKIVEVNSALTSQFRLGNVNVVGRNLFALLDFGNNAAVKNSFDAEQPVMIENCNVGFTHPLKKADGIWQVCLWPKGGGHEIADSLVLTMAEATRPNVSGAGERRSTPVPAT